MQTSPSIIKDLNHALDLLTDDSSHVMKLAAANLLRIISGEILADVAKDRNKEHKDWDAARMSDATTNIRRSDDT